MLKHALILTTFVTLLTACHFLKQNKPASQMSLSGDYPSAWKQVDSLEQQGLPKSALELVEKIAVQAKTENNSEQWVRTVIYRGKYASQLEEDGLVKAIQLFETEEQRANQPAKAILQSMLAEMYGQYLSQKGWELSDRTPLSEGEGGDVLTWSAAQIEKRAQQLHIQAVQPIEILQATPVNNLGELITKGMLDSIGKYPLRPTLFDLLAHRAMEFFQNDRNFITEPINAFVLNQPEAFAMPEAFVNTTFGSTDTSSGKYLGILLYQRLTRLHLNDADPAALIDATLLRLSMVRYQSGLEDWKNLYYKALEALHQRYKNHEADAEIMLQMANFKFEEASGVPEGKESFLKKEAAQICEAAIKAHPGTYGAKHCEILLNLIQQPTLQPTLEEVNTPEAPGLVYLKYSNVKQVWTRVVKVPRPALNANFEDSDEGLTWLVNQSAVQQKFWQLNDPGDYREHTTELKYDGLPVGNYYLLISSNESFDRSTGMIARIRFTISNLAPVMLEVGEERIGTVVNRRTGEPVAGVRTQLIERYWDNGAETETVIGETISNADGIVKGRFSERGNKLFRFIQGADTIDTNAGYYYRNDVPDMSRQVRVFTDRGIYRPGQTIYFKGILLEFNKKYMPSIVPNTKVRVRLLDVNYQERATITLQTNEFGSFNGTFTAPVGGLTGNMSIQVLGTSDEEGLGGKDILVEEYKRPKFEVKFKPVEGSFKLNESVSVTGEAINFAGNPVDGGTVVWRVTRIARWPWYYNWNKIMPWFNAQEKEIANGKVISDQNGRFVIQFNALPDPSIADIDETIFNYAVSAEVTDAAGETQSANTDISVSKKALELNVSLPEVVEMSTLDTIRLTTTNLSGQPVSAKVTFTLQQLVAPKMPYKNRLWTSPEYTSIEASVFKADFPDIAWKDEGDPKKWLHNGDKTTVETETKGSVQVNLNPGKKLTAGYYLVSVSSKDAFGQPVSFEQVVRIWDKNSNRYRFDLPDAQIENKAYEVGEQVSVGLGSETGPVRFYYKVDREGSEETWALANPVLQYTFKIREQDRGGIGYRWFAVKNNRFYSNYQVIGVPYTDKMLKISFETFRDKLAPGEKETWRLRISGPKKDKVAAEMVAAMYDASLDQFFPSLWDFEVFPHFSGQNFYSSEGFGTASSYAAPLVEYEASPNRQYQTLNWFGMTFFQFERAMLKMAAAPAGANDLQFVPPVVKADMEVEEGESRDNYKRPDVYDVLDGAGGNSPSPIRTNLKETVFFFPEMRTDANGDVILNFTMNEALTRWRFMAFAHTKTLQSAMVEKMVVTQKDLMITANPPRFLRAGDSFEFSAKIANLTQEETSGKASLELLDPVTLQSLNRIFGLDKPVVDFTARAGQSTGVFWKITVPQDYNGAVTWRVFAECKAGRDGEESTVPVVTNRMLVTETLPMTVRGNQTKSFAMPMTTSSTRVTQQVSLEFTSNPVWYAVQSLPYLMEYPHECSEQLFSRFYANTLASSVVDKLPQIRRVFDRWQQEGNTNMSPLLKNESLKYALLEETPWVLAAQSEEQQRKNIALLFDLNRMANEKERALGKLAERQSANGGWTWFPGGRESWYITQHIVTGMAHLRQLGAFHAETSQATQQMIEKAFGFCQSAAEERYKEIGGSVQKGETKWEDDHLDGLLIQYLYARSFYKTDRPDKVTAYYFDQAARHWLKKGLYEQGMLALALNRMGDKETAKKITASLKERALNKDELGMYWPNEWGMNWYQLPVETQALMIEVFGEVVNDPASVENLRIWLLKNKQTNRWESTKATADAVYALLLPTGAERAGGVNWLDNTQPVKVQVSGKPLSIAEIEAGTGYFKTTWNKGAAMPDLSQIKVENPNNQITWGAAYWQYFDDLNNITSFKKTGLTLVKGLYREENSPAGPVLKAVKDGDMLQVGDKLKVRIEIRADRPMEFVHLKDMRAAGMEPVNVLSGYRWQNGLGFYESTRDLATNFFIDYLPRGTYVLEYTLRVSHRGDMSAGIATLQCMYAPEFTSHSNGLKVSVK